MRLGEMIRRYRARLHLTQEQVAARTGIARPYLSGLETGRVLKPPSEFVLSRLERALGATPGQFGALYEDGVCRCTDDDQSSWHWGGIGDAADAWGVVPVINRVEAGLPRDFTDLDYPPSVAEEYVCVPPLDDPNAFGTRVTGDSMTPRFREGDVVVFSPSQAPRSGQDCFVRFVDGEVTFKAVYFELDGRIRLQPRNADYQASYVQPEELNGIYPAVYRIERLG